MQQLFVYADSLSWGIIPTTRKRLLFDQRWPGVLENELLKRGQKVRVLEDCLNGRRTVFEDPFLPGRNGILGLAQKIEMHSPIALVILMLGTNDFQSVHPHSAWHAAQGVATLVRTIRQAQDLADIQAIEPKQD
jgi:lysophospholipase L1-like esterase